MVQKKYWEEKPMTRDNTTIIIKNTHTIYEQVVTGMFSPNPYLLYNLFWKYNFLFTPTPSGTQPGHRSRSGGIPWHLLHS
jgi:hypothetical protein